MKKTLKQIIILLSGIVITSCAMDIVDLTGGIQGTVKDYESGQFVENCRVALSPGGKSTTTDANGVFVFEDLEAETYTLSFSKSGYVDETQEVSVVTGQITRMNVLMRLPSASKGAISGTIKDYASGQLISNCNISITPGGMSKTSSLSGTYEFSNLDPAEYSLTFSKAGYDDANSTVSVTAGKTTTVDVLLKAKSSFAISESNYDFGDLETIKTFYFFNNSDESCSFTISNVPEWLTFSKMSGTVTASGNEAVTATVDRDKVTEGEYSQNVTISFSGKTSGSVSLFVKMKKVVLSAPTVSIAGSAENIQQTSFDIRGNITATGGAQITGYGHCWNTTGEPTINDNKTDLGATSAICSFKSSVEHLSTYTTYYVRAYAKNSQGISYSEQIAVTTQDVSSDKWDGNIASSFASGSGSFADPYIIKTGGQLLLAKDYNDKYFELGGNIDLDNRNWLPYSFKGSIDGKGYSIINLCINRSDDYQGLFSKCSGTISNLTIRQVTIKAATSCYIGAFSGSGGVFNNCKVVLKDGASILGKNYVGGISGSGAGTYSNCFVESIASSSVIKGEFGIGGIIGDPSSDVSISDCHVSASISGESAVGGLVGAAAFTKVYSCSFTGEIVGKDCIGGLIGKGPCSIYGSKVYAKIISSGKYIGGILGNLSSAVGGQYAYIYGCYSDGSISANGTSGGIIGFSSAWTGETYLCYSTMTSDSSSFYGLCEKFSGKDCATVFPRAIDGQGQNVQASCTDITTFLREAYSEYANYWNFNNTWNWEGTIGSSQVTVNCPKLAWEK